MTNKEREIYAMLLQLCFEILPKTSMRNNKKINDVLALIKEHLDGQQWIKGKQRVANTVLFELWLSRVTDDLINENEVWIGKQLEQLRLIHSYNQRILFIIIVQYLYKILIVKSPKYSH